MRGRGAGSLGRHRRRQRVHSQQQFRQPLPPQHSGNALPSTKPWTPGASCTPTCPQVEGGLAIQQVPPRVAHQQRGTADKLRAPFQAINHKLHGAPLQRDAHLGCRRRCCRQRSLCCCVSACRCGRAALQRRQFGTRRRHDRAQHQRALCHSGLPCAEAVGGGMVAGRRPGGHCIGAPPAGGRRSVHHPGKLAAQRNGRRQRGPRCSGRAAQQTGARAAPAAAGTWAELERPAGLAAGLGLREAVEG